jgi:hypothetical protein
MPALRLPSLVIPFSRSLAWTSGLPFGMFPVLVRSHMWQAHYSLDRKSYGFGPSAWVRPAVIFEVVDRLLLPTDTLPTELTPVRTNMSFFNCLQQRNQTFQR